MSFSTQDSDEVLSEMNVTPLVEYGFRLPSALDNRPMRFEEFEALAPQTIYVPDGRDWRSADFVAVTRFGRRGAVSGAGGAGRLAGGAL